MTDTKTITQTLFEPDDIVELRFIKGKSPNAKIEKRWTLAADLPSMSDELHAWNREGYNIYFGPNPRKTADKSGDDNVLLARCFFCDFDHVEPGDGCGRLEFVWTDIFWAGLPEPMLAVHSGHGLHTYWKLSGPILDMGQWRSMQEKLNCKLGADPTIKNPERIMLMPGFMNTKKEPYQDCFICWSLIDANR